MTADCQACLVGVPQIGTPVGKPDDPIGACVSCGSLTCGQHGTRDPSRPFLCIQCDDALQAGCIGWLEWRLEGTKGSDYQAYGRAGKSDITADSAADALRALLPEGWDAPVTSFEDWAERRPYYGRLIELILKQLDAMVGDLESVARGMDYSIRQGTYPPDRVSRAGGISAGAFAAFWLRLDKDSKRLLAASLVLALVMNLPLWSLPLPLRSIAELADMQSRFRDDFPPPGQHIPFDEDRYR